MSAKRVKVYNADTFAVEPSEREYVEVGDIVNEIPSEYGHGYLKRDTTIYLDPITGLLVGDIHAYEAWVRS